MELAWSGSACRRGRKSVCGRPFAGRNVRVSPGDQWARFAVVVTNPTWDMCVLEEDVPVRVSVCNERKVMLQRSAKYLFLLLLFVFPLLPGLQAQDRHGDGRDQYQG